MKVNVAKTAPSVGRIRQPCQYRAAHIDGRARTNDNRPVCTIARGIGAVVGTCTRHHQIGWHRTGGFPKKRGFLPPGEPGTEKQNNNPPYAKKGVKEKTPQSPVPPIFPLSPRRSICTE